MIKTNYKYLLFSILAIIAFSFCKEKKDNSQRDMSIAALGLLSGGQSTTTAAQVRGSTSAVSSSISSSATNNQVGFLASPLDINKLMAKVHEAELRERFFKNKNPKSLATALAKDGGAGTCDNTGCNATISGTGNCTSGGTFTITSLSVNFTFSGSGSTFGYSATMNTAANKPIVLNACASMTNDFLAFPNYVSSVATGDLTFSGTTGIQFNSSSTSGSTTTMNYTVSENNTINSTGGLTINGANTGAISDLKTTTNLNLVSITSNVTFSTSGSITSFSATFNTTLTGTASTVGSIGGSAFSQSKTYNGETFNYSVSCTIDSSVQSSSCKVN